MKQGFFAAVLAAGLAGCGATPVETRNEKELPIKPGEGAFGGATSWTRMDKNQEAAAQADEYKKWQESASEGERREFEEWRAFQEWKRKNPK